MRRIKRVSLDHFGVSGPTRSPEKVEGVVDGALRATWAVKSPRLVIHLRDTGGGQLGR